MYAEPRERKHPFEEDGGVAAGPGAASTRDEVKKNIRSKNTTILFIIIIIPKVCFAEGGAVVWLVYQQQ